MSEATELPEEQPTEEQTEQEAPAQPDIPTVETAFIIMKTREGSWMVTSDVTTPFAIDRVAGRPDVRMGTAEISNLVKQQDLAALVAATIKASQESQENS